MELCRRLEKSESIEDTVIVRDTGRSGERGGIGGDAGGGEDRGTEGAESRLEIPSSEGGPTIPTRRERGFWVTVSQFVISKTSPAAAI